jgi:transposase
VSNFSKRYTKEFKLQAIKLAEKVGASKAAAELGVAPKSISDWIKKFKPESQEEVMASGKSVQVLEAENRRLRKENEYLNTINDVLKKSTAIFSKDQIKGLK